MMGRTVPAMSDALRLSDLRLLLVYLVVLNISTIFDYKLAGSHNGTMLNHSKGRVEASNNSQRNGIQ